MSANQRPTRSTMRDSPAPRSWLSPISIHRHLSPSISAAALFAYSSASIHDVSLAQELNATVVIAIRERTEKDNKSGSWCEALLTYVIDQDRDYGTIATRILLPDGLIGLLTL